MKATDLLKSQHDEVKKLFRAIERSKERREQKRLLGTIARNLAAHMVIEQEIFYPACARRLEDKSIVAEAFEEHGVAALQLSRTLDSRGGDTTFEAKAKVLKELIEHHVEEEETELFKKARRVFSADELEQLGQQMEALFESQFAAGYREVLAEPPPDASDAMKSGASRSGSARTAKRASARGGSTRRSKR